MSWQTSSSISEEQKWGIKIMQAIIVMCLKLEGVGSYGEGTTAASAAGRHDPRLHFPSLR